MAVADEVCTARPRDQHLRASVTTILATTLADTIRGAWAAPVPDTAARCLEQAVNHSARAAQATPKAYRQNYALTARAVNLALRLQVGPYPDDVLGLMFVRGAITAGELVERSLGAMPPSDPRETVRRMFVRTLIEAHERYASDRELVLETARAIEVSCYNAAVRASKESEDPPCRQWDSPAFVDIYGTRCGTIKGLLDPNSSACRAYGPTLVPRILKGEVALDALGDMTSEGLCPQATAAERAVIAKRVVQTVQVKESTLFCCPHCKKRRCTYQVVQRRSLDEAPDCLCQCLHCGRRFTGRS